MRAPSAIRFAGIIAIECLTVVSSCALRPPHGPPTAGGWCPSRLKPDGSGLWVTCERMGKAGPGRYLRFTCTVENKYAARIDGLLYVMGIFTRGEPLTAIPHRYVQSLNVTLESGETKRLNFDSERATYYAPVTSGPNLCAGVYAAPIELGEVLLPDADRW